MQYTVNFENDSTLASAPAQRVTVRIPLHENLNPLTLRIGNFGFAGMTFDVPENLPNYTKVLDVRDSLGVLAEVTAGLDIVNHEAFWVFQAIDPNTGLPPYNANLGLLPVNDMLGRGHGFVTYSIRPAATTVTGDTATAQASIVFDINDPILTNTWKNTIDALPPNAAVDSQPPISTSDTLLISWHGQDDPGGSGLSSVNVYVSEDGGPFQLYWENIAGTSFMFIGQRGSTYGFFAQGTDNVRNKEPLQDMAEVTVTIADLLDLAITKTAESCAGSADGTAMATASGGIPPYSYEWSDGQTTQLASGLSEGVYSLTVGDNAGTTHTASVTIELAPPIDEDEDGYSTCDGDCDDGNDAVHPDATEVCNAIDDDCNGLTDDVDPSITGQPTWYADADGDEYGNAASSTLACNQPEGYVSNNSDCDDSNPQYNLICCTPAVYTACPTPDITVNTASGACNAVVDYSVTAVGYPDPVYSYVLTGATTGSGSGSAGSGLIFSEGVTTVTITATNSCSAPVCAFTVTVQDMTPPTLICKNFTAALSADGQTAINAVDVFEGGSDNCGSVNLVSVAPNSFNCDNLGANTVTLTANDGHGNTAACNATVTVQDNLLPTVSCPGNVVTTNGSGECSIVVNYTVTAADNCSYTLTKLAGIASGQPFPVGITTNTWKAHDPANNEATCSFTVTVNKTGDPDLLYAYTAIGFKEVKMKTNTVQSGGVGVIQAGKKAKLEGGTLITAANTFVKAPVQDLSGGSQVTTYYQGQMASTLLPAFQTNNNPGNNNLEIPDNSPPVTLDLASYGNITIGKNVTATFSGQANVAVKELKIKEGAALLFNQNTVLRLDKKLETEKYVTINDNGYIVQFFVEDEVKIDEYSEVNANIFTLKDLKVEKGSVADPTHMTGLFIGDKVDAKEYVIWNWEAGYCPYSPALAVSVPNYNNNNSFLFEHHQLSMELFPNPAKNTVNVHLQGLTSAAQLTISDNLGRTVFLEQLEAGQFFLEVNLSSGKFESGVYWVTVKEKDAILTKRLIVFK